MDKSIFQSLKEIIKSHLIVLKYIFATKKFTEPSEDIGKIRLKTDENGKLLCNGCGVCKQVCPCKDLIKIQHINEDNSKISLIYIRDNSQCIFCGNCVEYCPQKALEFTREYIPATKDKFDLTEEYKNS